MMIVACDEESKKTLTTGEIISNAVTFLLAGYETTSSTLVFTVGLLAAHPHIQDKLAEEIGTYFNENPVYKIIYMLKLYTYRVTTHFKTTSIKISIDP